MALGTKAHEDRDRKIRDGNRVLAEHILDNGQLEPPPEMAEEARHLELVKAGYNTEASLCRPPRSMSMKRTRSVSMIS